MTNPEGSHIGQGRRLGYNPFRHGACEAGWTNFQIARVEEPSTFVKNKPGVHLLPEFGEVPTIG